MNRGAVVALGLALLTAPSCGDQLPTVAIPQLAASLCESPSGIWVLAAANGILGDRLLVLRIDTSRTRSVSELVSLSATGNPGLVFVPSSMVASVGCAAIDIFGAVAATGVEVRLHVDLLADTARGFAATPLDEVQGKAYDAFGLRIDPDLLVKRLTTSGEVG